MADENQALPYPKVTPIPGSKPVANPALWNLRYLQIDANFAHLFNLSGKAIQYTTPTGAALMPAGTTEQRGDPLQARLRFNTQTLRWEGANGTAWTSLGGATGGGNDAVFYEHEKVVRSDYTINANAISAGGIEIAPGATVTINPGKTWVIA